MIKKGFNLWQAQREDRKKSKADGLVWVGDAALDGFFRKRHPRIRWTRYAVLKRNQQ